MKKLLAAVLTTSIVISCATASFAKTDNRTNTNKKEKTVQTVDRKSNRDDIKKEHKKPAERVKKAEENKTRQVEKLKETLIKKCDQLINQIRKLKSYIVSEDGKFLVEFKDEATAEKVIKSLDDAIEKINSFKKDIEEAQNFEELRELRKDLQNNFIKHQAIVKRITGLTIAARLKRTYGSANALVDKLGAGIEKIPAEAAEVLDIEGIKAKYDKITENLEEAYNDYLEAVEMYSSLTDDAETDKSYKAAHDKLMEAKDGIHDVLIDTKKLLVEIKTSIHKIQDDEIKETDRRKDIDEEDDEKEDNDIDDDKDDDSNHDD